MILDTCALLWLAAGGGRLSRNTLRAIDEAEEAFVSAISAFEIALKCRAGKLSLPLPPPLWFERVVSHHDLEVLPIATETAFRSVELPPIHKDPADRFIIATALLHNVPVVTTDQLFTDYGVEVIS